MGCDLHAFVEGYTEKDKWMLLHELEINRDYDLYGALAGVRSTREPLYDGRGLPDDVSKKVFEEHCLIDSHDASYIHALEMPRLVDHDRKMSGNNESLMALSMMCCGLRHFTAYEDIRLVFWFCS